MSANTHQSLGLPQFPAQVKRISTTMNAHNPSDKGIFQFALNTRPSQNPRHSRERHVCTTIVIPAKAGIQRGGANGDTSSIWYRDSTDIELCKEPERGKPESTKHAFSPNPGNNHRPFRSQGMYESLTSNHWRSAARVLQWSLNTPMPKEIVIIHIDEEHHKAQPNHAGY